MGATPIDITLPHDPSETATTSRAELLEQVRGATGLFCLLRDRIDAELLDAAGPSLRVVSTMSVGVNHIDVAACRARNVHVGFTPGVLDVSTAETAVALTFAARRRLLECALSAKNGEWGADWHPFQYCGTSDVSGCTVGVVGLGRIGATFAAMMARGFRCRVLYTGPSKKASAAAAGFEFVNLETLLKESDVVSLHVPLTDTTRQLISTEQFKCMKPSAVLVNTSRGDVVDQDALVIALRNKTIAAAALDVTTPEPLPPTHALFALDNCIVLPHIASATLTTRCAMADIAVQNLVAGVRGDALPHAFE